MKNSLWKIIKIIPDTFVLFFSVLYPCSSRYFKQFTMPVPTKGNAAVKYTNKVVGKVNVGQMGYMQDIYFFGTPIWCNIRADACKCNK